MYVVICAEGIAPPSEREVKRGQHRDESKLYPDPPHTPIDDPRGRRQQQAEAPSRDHGRRHDPPLEATFHDFEGFRPVRAYRRHRMIDHEPRQVEQSRHPGNHTHNVKGFDPRIGVSEPSIHAGAPASARFTSVASDPIKLGSTPTVATRW